MDGAYREIVEALLARRGVSAADADGFLSPSLAGLADPSELPGVAAAADALLGALAGRRRIVVFGDYDCDGVCATAILVQTLRRLGGRADPFLPERLSEGYGMGEASIARMRRTFPDVDLVVTVDNGVNAVGPVAALRAAGVAVVVTDHHLPGETLPDADVLVDPKVAAPPRLSDLCGAGVAFLLARRLVSEARARGLYSGPNVGGPLLVLAGLATVTDIMPLLGQNRILVAEALAHFGAWASPGLKALYLRAARTASDCLTARDFGYLLGPRINASGRLASGMEALDLLLETDAERVRERARRVDLRNTERKAVETRMTDEAMAKIVPGAPAQVIDLPDGHPGVAGIVASRLLTRLGGVAPVCVIASGRGSGRAPASVNIRDAFAACADLLDSYGGHAAAGGFTVRPDCTDAFRARFCDYCARAAADAPPPAADEPEVWLAPADVTLGLADAVARLEPFGEGNPVPVFGLKGVSFSDVRILGADGRHLSLQLRGLGLRAVWWGNGERAEALRAAGGAPHDIAFTLAVSDYGERHVELRLVAVD